MIESRTFTLCGTCEYVSPEMLLGSGHGRGVDWWSLGVLVYEMSYGEGPFRGTTPVDVYRKVCAARPAFRMAGKGGGKVDNKVRDFIGGLLTRDRQLRLGCGRGGGDAVRAHPWFSNLDWAAVLKGQADPPYIPQRTLAQGEKNKGREDMGMEEAANYERYPDSEEDDAIPLNGKDRDAFDVFVQF